MGQLLSVRQMTCTHSSLFITVNTYYVAFSTFRGRSLCADGARTDRVGFLVQKHRENQQVMYDVNVSDTNHPLQEN